MLFLIGLMFLLLAAFAAIMMRFTFDTVGEALIPTIYLFGWLGMGTIAVGVVIEAVNVFI